MAHDLNNAMYLCGATQYESAMPETVQAELYRARDIETLDTAVLRILANGVDVLIGLSHSTRENFNPLMQLQCEHGTVEWSRPGSIIRYNDGSTESFEEHNLRDHHGPFHNAIDVLQNNATPLCPPEVARAQTLCVNGAHESCPNIVTVDRSEIEVVERDGATFHIIKDLDDLLDRSFRTGKLFSELGASWAISTQPYDLANYDHYPHGGR